MSFMSLIRHPPRQAWPRFISLVRETATGAVVAVLPIGLSDPHRVTSEELDNSLNVLLPLRRRFHDVGVIEVSAACTTVCVA